MGEVIRRTAAADDIVADLRTTLTNARARTGSEIASAAEARLAPLVTLIDSVLTRRAGARTEAGPRLAELDTADGVADRLVMQVEDELWNTLGRPAHDASFAILFPGGSGWYTDGDVNEEPERMEMLADLLASGVHPRLSFSSGAETLRRLRDGA